MQQVKHLLEAKGHDTFAIGPDAPVLDALKQMADKGVGALLVMRGEALAGIISERDYARKVILHGHSSADTPVADIMVAAPLTVDPETGIDECMHLCTESRVRHLPVMQGDKVAGIVSIGDLVKAVIDDQAEEIEQLQHYIAG